MRTPKEPSALRVAASLDFPRIAFSAAKSVQHERYLVAVCAGLSIFLCPLLLNPPISAAAEFQAAFGVIEGQGTSRRIVQETSSIPLRHRSTGFVWGFVVTSIPPGDYDGYFVIRPPSSPRIINESSQPQSYIEEGGRRITKKFRLASGVYWQSIVFDDGDPPGPWELSIYVEDKLVRAIRFDVQPDG